MPGSWFNPCAFLIGPVPSLGNLGRNTVIGPDFRNLDFSLAKEIPLHSESRKLQFRVESFNLANRPNFDIPNNVANSATFGQVTSADAFGGKPPRQIQLGLSSFSSPGNLDKITEWIGFLRRWRRGWRESR